MTDKELLQQWLQPGALVPVTPDATRILLDAIRARLSQCERCGEVNPAEIHTCSPQEPAAWVWTVNSGAGYITRGVGFDKTDIPFAKHTPLYFAPPQRQQRTYTLRKWQGLTAKDLAEIPPSCYEGAIWADAKLKEKNSG